MSDPSVSNASTIIQEIEQPITPENPCGEDITYDDAFQQLKAMIDRGTTVGGRIDQEKALRGGDETIVSETPGTDYEQIVALSREIMRTRSKDLRVAAYLTVGLVHTRGMGGMAEGFTGLQHLLETYWDDLYPAKRRTRARSSAIKFLADRLEERLGDYTPALEDREALEQTLALLEPLQVFLMDQLEEEAPALSSFKRRLNQAIRRLPEPPDETSAAESSPEESGEEALQKEGAEPPPDEPEPGPPSPSTPQHFERESDAYRAVLDAATFLYEEDKTGTLPYRLSRVVRWDILEREPSHEDRTTNIPPPEERRRSYLAGLLEKGQYADLLTEAETAFREPPFHFWLDLQRLVTAGMKAIGSSYDDACRAIEMETARLVRRLPQLSMLRFSDETPFADALTRQWIDEELDTVDGTSQGRSRAVEDEEDEAPVERLYEEARRELTRGQLTAALKIMNDGAGRDRSKEDTFRRRLHLASLCMTGDRPAVARPILEELDTEIQRYALDEWNPPLALEVWKKLYHCYEALVGSSAAVDKQQIRERAGTVYERICTIDPLFALSIER